jgi:ribosome maturation factor RimP
VKKTYVRFEGHVVDLTLKAPIGATSGPVWRPTAKNFAARLERAADGQWQLVWSEEPEPKPGQRVSKKKAPAPLQALAFTLDEIAAGAAGAGGEFQGPSSPCAGRSEKKMFRLDNKRKGGRVK